MEGVSNRLSLLKTTAGNCSILFRDPILLNLIGNLDSFRQTERIELDTTALNVWFDGRDHHAVKKRGLGGISNDKRRRRGRWSSRISP